LQRRIEELEKWGELREIAKGIGVRLGVGIGTFIVRWDR
jgi:hypothetical protein